VEQCHHSGPHQGRQNGTQRGKVVSQIVDAAKFTINILKQNLFERTADVGYLATDSEIVNFLKQSAGNGAEADPADPWN